MEHSSSSPAKLAVREQDNSMELDSWTHFLYAAGFGEQAARKYSDLFVKHEVDLDMLSELSHEVLLAMGIWKAGHRIRILRMKRIIYNQQQGQVIEDEQDKRGTTDRFIFSRQTFPVPIEPRPYANDEKRSSSAKKPGSPAKYSTNPATPQVPAAASSSTVASTSAPASTPVPALATSSSAPTPQQPHVVHHRSHPIKAVLAHLPGTSGAVIEVSDSSEDDSDDSDSEDTVYIRRPSVGAASQLKTSNEVAPPYETSNAIPIQHVRARNGGVVIEEVSGSWDAPMGVTPPAGSYMHYAGRQQPPQTSSPIDMEGSYGPHNGAPSLDQSSEFAGSVTPPNGYRPTLSRGNSNPHTFVSGSSPALPARFPDGSLATVIKYFINDDIVKHRMRLSPQDVTVSKFSQAVRQVNKLPNDDFAVFSYDSVDSKLKVVKESSRMREDEIYYVIEHSRLDKIYKKIEGKVKKDASMAMSDTKGRVVWNSDNNPMKVDFIPETEILMNQMGRIGLCMAPGRKKRKAHHDWDRDLDKDLDRIQKAFGCHVFVSLIRHSEMTALKIPNLFEEVEKRGMESIHFPIKDKWIPNSMDGLIALVDTLIQRLKEGKTVVIHCNGGKGRSATVAVAILIGLGKKVQNSIEVVRKARSGTIRNPLQIIYVKRFKKAWKAFQKKRVKLVDRDGSSSDDDLLTDDSEDVDDLDLIDDTTHDDDETSGTEGESKKEQKRRKADEERRLKDQKKALEREREEAKKRERDAKKEEEKRKKEEKQQKKEEEKQEREQKKHPEDAGAGLTPPVSAVSPPTSGPPSKSNTPKSSDKKPQSRTSASVEAGDSGDNNSGEGIREKKTFVKKVKEDGESKSGKEKAGSPATGTKMHVKIENADEQAHQHTSEAPSTPTSKRRKAAEEAAATAAATAPAEATPTQSEPAPAPESITSTSEPASDTERKKKRHSVESPVPAADVAPAADKN